MIQLPLLKFQPSQDDGDKPDQPGSSDPGSASRDGDLPYHVEVWDETGTVAEGVIAVTVNASVGYAAYYAAARAFPGRMITLSYNGAVLSRWTGQIH